MVVLLRCTQAPSPTSWLCGDSRRGFTAEGECLPTVNFDVEAPKSEKLGGTQLKSHKHITNYSMNKYDKQ